MSSMHPEQYNPDRAACVMAGSGLTTTHGGLETAFAAKALMTGPFDLSGRVALIAPAGAAP